MNEHFDLSRRRFVVGSAAAGGGLVIGFVLPGCDRQERDKTPPEAAVGSATTRSSEQAPNLSPNAFIRIARDGTVSFVVHKVEMGQGTFTSIPMLLAEELDVDLQKVKLEQAPANNALYADPLLGGQVTGGSTSVRGAWEPLRLAGATARAVLVRAAAEQWKVDAKECTTANGAVTHAASGRTAHYGELVDAAARLDPPSTVQLRKATEFRVIGKPTRRLDSADKVNGKAMFGIDARLPNMRVATVAASPVPGGKLASADEAKALAVPGVRQALKLDDAIAVVGDHMWAARQGLAAAAPTWNDGANANATIEQIVRDMDAASRKAGAVARNDGDAPGEIRKAKRRVEAVYQMPFLAHATMEPINCTVDLKRDFCDVYVGTQVPAFAQAAVANATGLPQDRVRIRNHYIGGGFGRRLEVDFIAQAAAFARQAHGPLKVVWTREEDVRHDMYRPYYLDRIAAALDGKGKPVAWAHRITGSSIMARFAPGSVKDGIDSDAVEGAKEMPYGIPAVRVEYVRHEPPLATAFWRGVGATHNIWVVESFVDELAAAAGNADPVAFRMQLLEKSPRHRGVLKLAAERAGWGQPLAAREGRKAGRGVAVQFAFGSYMAQVAEVSVGAEGDVQVHRVVCAVDCGQAVNPDGIAAQVESGIVFGLSAGLWQEVTLEKGRVVQGNFTDYRVMRINEMPQVEVFIVTSTDKPGGIGETATACSTPALTNAVFAATGKRVRRLPIGGQLKQA